VTEILRELSVTIEVDTNKQTYREKLTFQEGETLEEFNERVTQKLSEMTEAEFSEITEVT
jgi:hypothetical protein